MTYLKSLMFCFALACSKKPQDYVSTSLYPDAQFTPYELGVFGPPGAQLRMCTFTGKNYQAEQVRNVISPVSKPLPKAIIRLVGLPS